MSVCICVQRKHSVTCLVWTPQGSLFSFAPTPASISPLPDFYKGLLSKTESSVCYLHLSKPSSSFIIPFSNLVLPSLSLFSFLPPFSWCLVLLDVANANRDARHDQGSHSTHGSLPRRAGLPSHSSLLWPFIKTRNLWQNFVLEILAAEVLSKYNWYIYTWNPKFKVFVQEIYSALPHRMPISKPSPHRLPNPLNSMPLTWAVVTRTANLQSRYQLSPQGNEETHPGSSQGSAAIRVGAHSPVPSPALGWGFVLCKLRDWIR